MRIHNTMIRTFQIIHSCVRSLICTFNKNIPAVACTGADIHLPPDTAADDSYRQLELQERAGPPRVQAPDSDEVQPTRDFLRAGMCFYYNPIEKTVKFVEFFLSLLTQERREELMTGGE
jgi:hypothetical protein